MAIVFLRTLIIYFALLATMRLLGKRQLGEMELSEFVVAALIADLAAHPLQDIGIPMLNGLVPIVTLFCCEVLISGLSLKSIKLRTLLFGRPSRLIRKGVIDQTEMRKNRFTLDELLQELRSQGVSDVSKVDEAILETDGRLTVLLYPSELPPTAAMMGLKAEGGASPVILVSDGRILDESLRALGRDREWLEKRLREHGARDAKSVYLLTADEGGRIYFAKKEASL
ncbi:MAG: DUF421 domain-containing protein [Oscillospiraceae bacterium]|nr:DUF421 domain-containing protein [Oscillospiraceae bacterium]